MEAIINQLLSTGTLILACAVFIATFFVRRVVETAVPTLAKKADENETGATYETTFSRWWNKVILRAVPVVIGALAGLISLPYVFGEIESMGDKCLYGFVVGWFSSFLYKVGRRLVVKHVGVEDPGDELPE